MYITWTRGEIKKLGKFFSSKELECRCGVCQEQKISQDLLSKLDLLRQSISMPITITSGYRCPEYQIKLLNSGTVETVKNSQHVLGNAADLTCKDVTLLLQKAQEIFMAVGDGSKRKFIHVDTRSDKKRFWDYLK